MKKDLIEIPKDKFINLCAQVDDITNLCTILDCYCKKESKVSCEFSAAAVLIKRIHSEMAALDAWLSNSFSECMPE